MTSAVPDLHRRATPAPSGHELAHTSMQCLGVVVLLVVALFALVTPFAMPASYSWTEHGISESSFRVNESCRRVFPSSLSLQAIHPCGNILDEMCTRVLADPNSPKRDSEVRCQIVSLQITVPYELGYPPSHAQTSNCTSPVDRFLCPFAPDRTSPFGQQRLHLSIRCRLFP